MSANVWDLLVQSCLLSKRSQVARPYLQTEPNVPIIRALSSAILLAIHPDSDMRLMSITPFVDNKVYEIQHPDWPIKYLFRTALAADPVKKTESEIATLSYVKKYTTIPVPTPIAWDSSTDNELGFEWSLVEKIEGIKVKDAWENMPWEAKVKLADDLALICAQLWSKQFGQTGSLTLGDGKAKGPRFVRSVLSNAVFKVNEMVAPVFSDCPHLLHLLADRGPYRSSHNWLHALILFEKSKIVLADEVLRSCPGLTEAELGLDDNFREDAEERKQLCDEYLKALPWFFPPIADSESRCGFILTHEGLHESSILVDPTTYAITGIVNWDMSRVLPVWLAQKHPKLIDRAFVGDDKDSPLLSAPNFRWGNNVSQEEEDAFIAQCKQEESLLRRCFEEGIRRFGMSVTPDLSAQLKDEFCFGVHNLSTDWDVADAYFCGLRIFIEARKKL